MLEQDYIEAIIGLPGQLFYNTDIAIYVFVLSKNKSKERKNKIQLIDATDIWEPMRRSLGKKRREISKEQITLITEVYTVFAEGEKHQYSDKRKTNCVIKSKIFPREEFLYKEWAVYQPLQRSGSLSEENIKKLKTSQLFTANSHFYNESKMAELEQMNPRSTADEKAYQKMQRGKTFVNDVLSILDANQSEKVYKDFRQFEKLLKSLLSDLEGMTPARLNSIAIELSEIDKTAIVQKLSLIHI